MDVGVEVVSKAEVEPDGDRPRVSDDQSGRRRSRRRGFAPGTPAADMSARDVALCPHGKVETEQCTTTTQSMRLDKLCSTGPFPSLAMVADRAVDGLQLHLISCGVRIFMRQVAKPSV